MNETQQAIKILDDCYRRLCILDSAEQRPNPILDCRILVNAARERLALGIENADLKRQLERRRE